MLRLPLAYMADRKLMTGLNILLLALAVATLVMLLVVSSQLSQRLSRNAQGIDLVVGAKGAPLQLILSAIYQMDQPTGNIPLSSIALLRRNPMVAQVIPMALGDNFRGYRIVGTEPAYIDLYGARIDRGRMFGEHGEVVLGAEAASRLGAGLGQKFLGSHGLSAGDGSSDHDSHPFETVGILQRTGTVIDRLVLTSIETVWEVHGIGHEETAAADHADEAAPDHEDEDHDTHATADADREVTALLVRYRSPAAAVRIPPMINRQTSMQAAVPAVELSRLLGLLGAGIEGARLFAWLLALIGGLSIFVTLLNAASAREADLALLRVMGASRAEVFGVVLAEGLLTALLGAAVGVAIGHIGLAVATELFVSFKELGLQPWEPVPGEIGIVLAVIAVGLSASLLPALRVFRMDLAHTLGRTH
ncbi:ABC transporter permease [Sphingobium algorifonticola]|uniref:ABC transporter permease n=2 Tax=Sphingobium algorifonticola TaxID=2008318 RepID=A0A437J5K0_9SPHN|nr:ABC transporter permease [Sphingobium algorifonticola]